MKVTTVIIIGFVVFIIGIIVFMASPILGFQAKDPGLFLLMASIGTICMPVGFFTFCGGITYWIIKRFTGPRKVMLINERGEPIKQNTVKSAIDAVTANKHQELLLSELITSVQSAKDLLQM